MTVDAVALMGFTIVVLALLPSVEKVPALRLSLALVWWSTLFLYEPVMVARFGGTLGHLVLNLRVVDNRTGANFSLLKAGARLLMKALFGVFSFLSMSLTKRHQAVHDFVTATTVQIRDVSKAAPHHYRKGPRPTPPPEST